MSKAAESARLRSRRFVFRTLDFVLDESDLHNRIRQVSGANMLEGYSEKFALLQRDHVGNNNDDASVKRFFAVQINEVGAIVRDERVLLLANNTHKLQSFRPPSPRWLTWSALWPAEMGNGDKGGVQAFINQKLHFGVAIFRR